jgi:hypothetical protein
MSRLHVVSLSPHEEAALRKLLRKRGISHLQRTHARVLLLADVRLAGYLTNEQIGREVGLSVRSVIRTRVAYTTAGLDAAVGRKPRSDTPRRLLTAGQATRVVELAVSPAPDGSAHWTLSLLRDELIARGIVPTISKETVRMTLKKGAVLRG